MTIGKALVWAEKFLSLLPAARLEAEVLLAHILAHDRSWLLARTNQHLSPFSLVRFAWFVYQRRRGTPSAYLTHQAEFFGHTFMINKHVLVPRPETETIIEVSSEIIKREWVNKIIELGTGSGCVILSLMLLHPTLESIGTDISHAALKLAEKNARRLNMNVSVRWLCGNLLKPVEAELSRQTVVITNLPYLTQAEIVGSLKREPKLALAGGNDGLAVYDALLSQLSKLPTERRPNYVILEIHPPTLPDLRLLIERKMPGTVMTITNDLTGRPRVMVLRLA